MAGTTLRMSTPARAPIAKAARVHAAKPMPRRSNNPGLSGLELGKTERRGEIWLVVPGGQHAEGSARRGHHDPERHQLGERPAPSTEALSPGEPEGAGSRTRGRAPAPRRTLRSAAARSVRGTPLERKLPYAVEVVDQAVAGGRARRMAGGRGGVGVVQLEAGDQKAQRQRAEKPEPRRSARCGVGAR